MTLEDLRWMSSRLDLGRLFTKHAITATGVEVGTFEGKFAYDLLSTNDTMTLHCVDPWTNQPVEEYRDGCNITDMEFAYAETKRRLEPFGDRVRLMRMMSEEAVNEFEDQSLDFVYLDGNHRFDHAYDDFEMWLPKVKEGGILGLHDCYARDDDAASCGVWDVVWEKAHELNQQPVLLNCTSVFFIKEE